MPFLSGSPATRRAAGALLALACCLSAADASEFFVSPVRAELKAGALNESISVTNRGSERLRVAVKVMAWTQDAQGNDVYRDTDDLVYFPRQMEIAPQGKRVIRVGAKSPAGATERTYRLFIEEQPEAAPEARPQVSVYFRFGVPIFLVPASPRPQLDIAQSAVDKGRLSVQLKNEGNRHARILRVKVDDGAGFEREVGGWYALAGTERNYTIDIPRDVCRRSRTLNVVVEGEGVRADRKVDVDPARCL
jgi:fimbrial chaperone protein